MNICNITCLIAVSFIVASIYTMITCKSCSPFVEYEKSLNPEQQKYYKEVVGERQNIYLTGLVIGFLLGFLYLYLVHGSLNPLVNACMFATIILLFQYVYYILSPKKSMLDIIDNKDQITKWHAVYKYMQYKYHMGFLIGGIGYVLFAYGTQIRY